MNSVIELCLDGIVMWTYLLLMFPEIGLLRVHLIDWDRLLLSIEKIRVSIASLRNIMPQGCLIGCVIYLIGVSILPLVNLRKSLLALRKDLSGLRHLGPKDF